MDYISNNTDFHIRKLEKKMKAVAAEAYSSYISGDYDMGDAFIRYINNDSRQIKGKYRFVWDCTERKICIDYLKKDSRGRNKPKSEKGDNDNAC